MRTSLAIPLVVLLAVSCSRALLPYGQAPEALFDDPVAIAICDAILSGDNAAFEKLVAADADLSNVGTGGVSLLLWTVETGEDGFVRRLLEAGADPNLQDDNGRSPVSRAAQLPAPGLLTAMLEHGANADLVNPRTLRTPLVEAVMHLRRQNIVALLDHGANPDYATPDGQTVCITAASINRYDFVNLLLESGASVRKATATGLDLVKLLERDLSNSNLLRDGPLFEAKGSTIELLGERGIDVSRLRQLYGDA